MRRAVFGLVGALMVAVAPAAVAASAPVRHQPGTDRSATSRIVPLTVPGHDGFQRAYIRTGRPAPAVQATAPKVALTVKVSDRAGKPVTDGLVYLCNMDDSNLYCSGHETTNGQIHVSVPLGNYSAIAQFEQPGKVAKTQVHYQLPIADYLVSGAGQTLSLDAKHVHRMAITTPRPATMAGLVTDWVRLDPNGRGLEVNDSVEAGSISYVGASPRPTVGEQRWMTLWHLAGQPTKGIPYTYDATYEQLGRISANQTHKVTNAQVARVDSYYYSDGPRRTNGYLRTPHYPFGYQAFDFGLRMSGPLHRMEYVVGPLGVSWSSVLVANTTPELIVGEAMVSGSRLLPAGSRQRVNWLRGPLAPGFVVPTDVEPDWECDTCRVAKEMSVQFDDVTDADPNHAASFDSVPDGPPVMRFRLYRNGRLISNVPDGDGDTVAVPAGSATYRAIQSVRRDQDGFIGSPKSTMDVTFHSSATSGAPLPKGWNCGDTTICTVLPILQARIPLPTDLSGHLPVGTSTTAINVDHVAGAAKSAIRSAKLQLSNDAGKTWRAAPTVALGGGNYRAVLTYPRSRAGHWVSLRLTATDAAGGKLVKTVTNAYSVGK